MRFIFLILLLCGCTARKPDTTQFWSVAPFQESHAVQIGRQFAVEVLGLQSQQVARMVARSYGVRKGSGYQISVSFWDPEVFSPNVDGFYMAMDGGFPSYFRVNVDSRSWKVVSHYASDR